MAFGSKRWVLLVCVVIGVLVAGTYFLRYPPAQPSRVRFDAHNIGQDFTYAYGATTADFDGDGRLDIVASDSWTKSAAPPGASLWIYWSGREPQRIEYRQKFKFLKIPVFEAYLLERLVPIDIDGDGLIDVTGVVNSHGAVVAYRNPGRRGASWPLVVLSDAVPGAVNLAAADVDGDGDLDLFVSMRQPATFPGIAGVAWIENPGRAGPWRLRPIALSTDVADHRTVVPHDFNLDGRVDLLATDTISGEMAWYGNLGQGKWTRHVFVGIDARSTHYSTIGDVDGDGQADVVTGDGGDLIWLRCEGNHWTRETVARLPNWRPWRSQFLTEVAVTDIDGDGRADIAFALARGGTGGVYWARNLGDGRWQVQVVRGDWGQAVGLTVPDLNGDGRPDLLAVGEYGAQQVVAFLNRGLPHAEWITSGAVRTRERPLPGIAKCPVNLTRQHGG